MDFLSFIDARGWFGLLHLLGIALGAGGAYMSDLMFLFSAKDRVFSASEIKFMKLGSRMVWAGLALLIVSGIALVIIRPEIFLKSEKFWAKITIVGIILINGIIFHLVHLPRMTRQADKDFTLSEEFMKYSRFLMTSGAISMVSWTLALVLGALRSVPYSYGQIMIFYLVFLTIAIIASRFLVKLFLSRKTV